MVQSNVGHLGRTHLATPVATSVRSGSFAATLVGLLAIVPAFTNAKMADVQPADFVLLFLLGACLFNFLYRKFSFRISARLTGLFWAYGILLATLVALSIASLRLEFFPIGQTSFLKQPVIFSAAKILQLAAIVAGFFWLANAFIKERRLLTTAVNAYWWTGIVSSVYAIVCCCMMLLLRIDPQGIFGAYYNADGSVRAQGLINEGGPFGLYLVSVCVVGVLRRHLTGRKLGATNMAIILLAFFLAASKSACLAGALLGLYAIFSAASWLKKIIYLLLAAILFSAAAIWFDLGTSMINYVISYENIEEEIESRGNDANLIAGRISALYIVPRMIEEHPYTGIGYGNYGLMRNDPNYLGPLPPLTESADLPALGFPGVAAEIGIPATLAFIVLLFVPAWWSRGKGSVLVIAALFQPLAHIFAVQLTFFYPWFVTACALGALSYTRPAPD
jgi:hypothetical protein